MLICLPSHVARPQINQKARFIRAGQSVVDLGCGSGGWLATVAHIFGSNTSGTLIGIDIARM
jgi:23S rRNA U2552 (ribose-2'-O)-methylase RlmE/FtsJ